MKFEIDLTEDQAMELFSQLKAEGLEQHYQEWLARQAFPENVLKMDDYRVEDEMKSQLEALFRPLNPIRVKKIQGQSYLETWDVIAHLSRIFGPLGWSKHVVESHLVYEDEKNGKWTVTYAATVRLVVHSHNLGKTSEDVATGTAINQPSRGDAHDLALKTAVSDALKRCAKDLGNQFGLSLYNRGSANSVLGRSLAHPELDPQPEPEEAE